jgi:hypothetical protein
LSFFLFPSLGGLPFFFLWFGHGLSFFFSIHFFFLSFYSSFYSISYFSLLFIYLFITFYFIFSCFHFFILSFLIFSPPLICLLFEMRCKFVLARMISCSD